MPWWVELELGRNREVRREVLKTRCFQSRVRRLYYLCLNVLQPSHLYQEF